MPNEKRGEIHSPERARQLRNFSGLLFGNITPTDIDGLIEYHDKGYVIIELKYRDAEILRGQELALERMTDDFQRAKKKALCIIATHQEDNPQISINVADTIVTKYRYLYKWTIPKETCLTHVLIEWFFEHKFN